ncbi:MAG: hypothetical protein WB647_16115 [Roseiarcus sp.]|uniref:hypothetical protein n=1 Tax=Roseiarcus sp. TaxID=1969460 RepID=UPI003C58E204
MKIVALLGALLFAVTPAGAQTSLDWPDMIELLAQQRSQAEACVQTLESSSDKAALATGRLTYGVAKSQSDGVIAGLTVALVQGGEPAALPTALTSLRKAGDGLQEVCNAALTAASAAGSRGVVEDILKAPIEPVVNAISSGVSALWTGHVENDKLELETIRGQLEAAKWPNFGS